MKTITKEDTRIVARIAGNLASGLMLELFGKFDPEYLKDEDDKELEEIEQNKKFLAELSVDLAVKILSEAKNRAED